MRWFVGVVVVGALGCCLGGEKPSAPPPAAAPAAAPSPLSQALGGLGVTEEPATDPAAPAADPAAPGDPAASSPGSADPAAPPAAAPPAAASPTAAAPPAPPVAQAAPATVATSATPDSPACARARADRDRVRATVASVRLSLGADTSARLDAANRALLACNSDPACVGDGRARLARVDAYNAAKAAHDAESRRLAEAEVGLFHADQAVAKACGAP